MEGTLYLDSDYRALKINGSYIINVKPFFFEYYISGFALKNPISGSNLGPSN